METTFARFLTSGATILGRARSVLIVLLGVLLLAAPVFSQTANGRIAGVVKDQTGGAIVGATVVVTDVNRGLARNLTTDQAGAYLAPNLIPGVYSVRATFTGFQAWERTNINLGVGGDIAIDAVLVPGAQTQTVTVSEELPLVNTTSATLGGGLQSETILDLPLGSRNYKNLMDLRPGTVTNLGNNSAGGGGGAQSVNGLRNDMSVEQLVEGLHAWDVYTSQSVIGYLGPQGDGGTIMPVDAIQEFNQQVNAKAEYGWKAGSSMNLGLKSGTNALHGTAYSFFRNAATDAREYFNTKPQPAMNGELQQFGATVGGPIKRDKLFFFLGWEQMNQAHGGTAFAVVPFTDEKMIANFPACITSGPGGTNTCAAVANSVAGSRTPDASNHLILACLGVPAASRSPQSLSLVSLNNNCTPASKYPYSVTGAPWVVPHGGNDNGATADLSVPINAYFPNTQVRTRGDGGVAKLDYTLNDKNTVNGFFWIGNGSIEGDAGNTAKVSPIVTSSFPQRPNMIAGTWTYLPNPSWANTFRAGRTILYAYYRGHDVTQGKTPVELGLPTGVDPVTSSTSGLVENGGYPQAFQFAGFAAWGSRMSETRDSESVEINDGVSYLRGSHSIKFGGMTIISRQNGGNWQDTRGRFVFGRGADATGQGNGLLSFIAGQSPLTDNIPGSQNAFCPSPGVIVGVSPNATCVGAAMIRSQPTTGLESARLAYSDNEAHMRRQLYGIYVQDDWRIRPRLTLNLGLRYDLATVPRDRDEVLGQFDPELGLVQEGIQINSIHRGDHNNFSPRLGFAWDIFGTGKTVLRGGGSIITDTMLPYRAYNENPGLSKVPTNWTIGCTVSTQNPDGSVKANPAPAGSPFTTNCEGLGGVLTTSGGTRSSGVVNWSRGAGNIVDVVHWDGPINGTNASIFPGLNQRNCSPFITVRDNPNSTTESAGAGCDAVRIDPNLRAAYVETWSLSLQHAIVNNVVLDLAYVGNHGVKMDGHGDLNQPHPGSGWTQALIDLCNTTRTASNCDGTSAASNALSKAARPYSSGINPSGKKFPYLNTITYISGSDTSNYNGLQVTLTARNLHGLSITSGYTWSKSLEVSSSSWTAITATDSYNVGLDYGRGSNDIRHRFTMAAIYAIPGRAGYGGLLQGWKLNSIVRFQTGLPWEGAPSGDFMGTDRTTRWDFFGKASDFNFDYHGDNPAVFHPGGTTVPSGTNPKTGVAYVAGDLAINTDLCTKNARSAATLQAFGCWTRGGSAIIAPPPNSVGNMAKGLFSSFPYFGLDMSVTKTQRITERFSAEFRAESFNIVNHPMFFLPGNSIGSCTVDSCTFGVSSSTPAVDGGNPLVGSGGPRRFQFGVKIIF